MKPSERITEIFNELSEDYGVFRWSKAIEAYLDEEYEANRRGVEQMLKKIIPME